MKIKRLVLIIVMMALLCTSVPVFASPTTAPLYQTETGLLQSILDGIVHFFTSLINGIWQIGEAVVSAIVWIINAVIEIVRFFGEAIGVVLNFFGQLIVLIVNTFIEILGNAISFVIMFISTIFRFIVDVINNIVQVIRIVALVMDVVVSLAGVVLGWFFQVIQLFFGILAGINGATPTEIPGLPRCVTAPMDSQICGVWYVVDWTLLDGTPGVYIVPIVVLMIDFAILVYIVKSIFKLVRWFQSLYEVA